MRENSDNIYFFFWGGGGGRGVSILCLSPIEILVIRNKTSSPEDFESTRFDCT